MKSSIPAPVENGAIAERLQSIDWDFENRSPRSHEIESIHPYPAKFIGDIPHAFLSSLPVRKGTAVLDPFCGSGTTLTESQRSGLACIGVDLNPIACLIARVKTAPFPHRFEHAAIEVIEHAHSLRNPRMPPIPNVDHWFTEEAQEAIAALAQAIDEYRSDMCSDALRLGLSSIIVRVSRQESDTRYAAVDRAISKKQVLDLFLAACGKIARALRARNWVLTDSKVIEGDTLALSPEEIGRPVGIVITSPPYPNAYEYWLYHKYRMWWLGFDPLSVKAREIGARAHFFKTKHHTEEHFWDQMRKTFNLIGSVLVRSGFACFVVGRSKIHGRLVDNAEILQTVALEKGLRVVARMPRVISSRRKSFNLAHANIKSETVIVFQKG